MFPMLLIPLFLFCWLLGLFSSVFAIYFMQQLKRVMYKGHPSVVWVKRAVSKELSTAELFDWMKRAALLLITFGSRRASFNYLSFNRDLDSILKTDDPQVKAIVDRLLWSMSVFSISFITGVLSLVAIFFF
jgi:hypothetical protein